MELINNLGFMMKAKNLSVLQLSKETGISRGTIYRILEGKSPSPAVMIKLSKYFEKPLGDLFCA